MNNENEIFTVRATRCKRCGGLLINEKAIEHGMGHTCRKKYEEELVAKEMAKWQLSFFPDDETED